MLELQNLTNQKLENKLNQRLDELYKHQPKVIGTKHVSDKGD